jgi:hypothetical protein
VGSSAYWKLDLLFKRKETTMTTEEKIKAYAEWLSDKEAICEECGDHDTARIMAGVKSMFDNIFELK